MSEFFAQNALLFAGEAFVMSAVMLALAWEASHLVPNRASLRHLVWVSAFLALLLLPVLALLVPAQIHFTVTSSPSLPVASIAQDADIGPDIASMPAPSFHIDIVAIALATIGLWLAGVFAIVLRGLVAMFGLHALRRGSRAHIFDDLPVDGHYRIRLSKTPNGYGPITWGLFRPVILLPFNAHFWPRERLQAVLLHEIAHIRRRDAFSQMLSLLVCTLYWPNPLVWLAARSLRNEAEIAADDQVIASGMRPSSYAGELLQLVSEFRSRQPALAGMPLFMAAPSALEARVKSVLAPTQSRSGVTSMDVLKIGGIAIMAAAALTVARPSLAQDTPDVPPVVERAPLPAPDAVATPAPVASPEPVQAVTPPNPVTPVTPVAQADRVRPYIKVHRSERMVHGHKVRHVSIDIDTNGASAEEMERMRPEIARAEAEARAAQSEMLNAETELRAHQAEIRAMQEAGPRVEAEVQAALAKAQPEIDRAIAEARAYHMNVRVREKVDHAMHRAQVRIDMHDRDTRDTPDDEVPDGN